MKNGEVLKQKKQNEELSKTIEQILFEDDKEEKQ